MSEKRIDIESLIKHFRQEKYEEAFIDTFVKRMIFSLAKDNYGATGRDYYMSAAYAAKDHLVSRWAKTQQEYYHQDSKRVYYMSMEFLTGRALGNNLVNLGLYDICKSELEKAGLDLDYLIEYEPDAGLGNGGLGRLAACFLDSMATLQLPGYGYGIRYEYGIFRQQMKDGYQIEVPDNWLRYENPWENARPEYIYPIHFYGNVTQHQTPKGDIKYSWENADVVMAMAYDTPIPGYGCNTVNTFRLWSAKSSHDFNLEYFNRGDYVDAMEHKSESETISKVLYPEDSTHEGKQLRLKQEYFFVSATLQDILRRFDKVTKDINLLPDKVAIQLNDTHPAMAVVELMRLFIDERNMDWDTSWDITRKVFSYTNHTILPEALERWKVSLLDELLPRHMQLIYEINRRFLKEVWIHNPGDNERQQRMSLIEEGDEKKVRMANLSIVGSHSVNGVSELHTEIIKNNLFRDFYELTPEKFNCKTNGVTQRRWLYLSNPRLSDLLEEKIGTGFVTDLYELKKLIPLAKNKTFQKKWQEVKHQNKVEFARYVNDKFGFRIDPNSMFDIQIKRMHEYKRQLMNVLHVIHLYKQLRDGKLENFAPRTIIFAGKAAPGYHMAKLIIKLITSVGDIVNNDPLLDDKLKVIFLPNYSVSMAQRIFPAADLSEQISTAGMEASGTGNMKFSLNGALTIGTLDGANIEIGEEVGAENIFICGLKIEEVKELKAHGYNPMDYYNSNYELKTIIDMITNGYFNPDEPDLFRPITDSLLYQGDQYCVLADFESYIKCQHAVSKTYLNQEKWTEMAILNVANMGKFSTDRTIKQYAEEIWNIKPVHISFKDDKKIKGKSPKKKKFSKKK
ncbi:glycogen/starch/alpha-glucan phosphorylase [bacterium]|nr:glycogen/starch/alpha-glucan phosphorylase [bacterium]